MSRPKQIKCQYKADHGAGCSRCGGYVVVLMERPACVKCRRKAWFRPGVHTTYDGKQYESWDGLALTVTAKGDVCMKCLAKLRGNDVD